jgi:hypothetical protein
VQIDHCAVVGPEGELEQPHRGFLRPTKASS